MKKKGKLKAFFEEFKAFINKGNAFMLAVGVVIGGAFNAIVTALVNILMSLATWGVPGGLKGLVTVLPALSDAQKGAEFMNEAGTTYNAQFFSSAEVNQKVIDFAKANDKVLTTNSEDFVQWKNSLLSLYDLHGTTYTSKMSAVIDWGSFINAIIAFIIIGLTLFVIVKVINSVEKKNLELREKALEQYYEKHPEERPVPPEPGEPELTEMDVLCEIRDALVNKKTE